MAEPFTLVEHDMCISEVDGSKKKNKNSLPVPTHPIQAQNKENLPKPPEDTRQKPNQILKALEPEDKDVSFRSLLRRGLFFPFFGCALCFIRCKQTSRRRCEFQSFKSHLSHD